MRVENGHIYVAQGGKHMVFYKEGIALKIKLDDGPQENFCKPAVDPMLRSLVRLCKEKLLVVILTGMGIDGLKGCEDVARTGGTIIAQDQATSVVWGMPGAVAHAGICHEILPVSKITEAITKIATGGGK